MFRSNVAHLTLMTVVLIAPTLLAQEAEPAQDAAQEKVYAVLFAKGPGYVEETGTRGQPGMVEHVEFIMGLHAEGVVPLAGPLFDDDEREHVSGVLYFIRAGSLKEAREIALQEPMVRTKVVEVVSVREFLTGVGVGRLD